MIWYWWSLEVLSLLIKGVWFARKNLHPSGSIEFKTVRYVSSILFKLLSCLDVSMIYFFKVTVHGRSCCCKIYICDNVRLWVFVFWIRLLELNPLCTMGYNNYLYNPKAISTIYFHWISYHIFIYLYVLICRLKIGLAVTTQQI